MTEGETPASPARPPEGWIDPSLRDQLRHEARVVGLRDADMPTLEAVERRRVQLWSLSTVLLVVLSSAVVASMWWRPDLVGERTTNLVLRSSVLVLTVAFAVYSFEKEAHLRRLSRLLLDERLLTTALSSRLRELSLLLEAGKAMNSVLELPQVLTAILRSALELLEGSNGSIMLLDEDGTELRSVAHLGNEGARRARVRVGEGIAGSVAARLQPLLIDGRPDPQEFPGLAPRDTEVQSAMCVPLVHRDEAMGVLNVNAAADRRFSEYDLRALSLFAEQAAGTIAKARLFEAQREQAEQLAHLAFHDPLTGLANRALFLDRARLALARARRHPGAVAVLFVDLDGFKAVNDTLGHAAGDELLVEAAARLRAVVRPSDTLARFGGDEFVVLCEGLAGEIEAVGVAARIEESLGRPFRLGAGEATVTSSVGVALAADSSDDPETLVRDADTAMYRAKERGRAHRRARPEVLDAATRADATGRLRVESALRHALEQKDLGLDYEPVVDLRSGTLVAAAASPRLLASDGAPIAPEDLLAVAEQGPLAVPLGHWVLQRACREAARWQRPGADGLAPVAVAVGLPVAYVADPCFPGQAAAALGESALQPDALHLELAGCALAGLSPSGLEALRHVAASGVHLGIGGVAAATLPDGRPDVPFDFVTIHPSVVGAMPGDHDAVAVAGALVRLAAERGVRSIAAGVESADQADCLRDLGCDTAHGRHFARAGPPSAWSPGPR